MSWAKPTRDDLTARLSEMEQDAHSGSSGFAPDVVDGVLRQTVAFARDAVRSGGRVRMSGDPAEIPQGLLRPVLAIATVELLSRLDITVNETRTAAAREAEAYLAKVAKGEIVPEGFDGEGGVEATGPGPQADDGPVRTLGGGLW